MKKLYVKPEACCIDSKTGVVFSTSEVFAERAVEIKRIFENEKEIKEGFTDGRETAGKS